MGQQAHCRLATDACFQLIVSPVRESALGPISARVQFLGLDNAEALTVDGRATPEHQHSPRSKVSPVGIALTPCSLHFWGQSGISYRERSQSFNQWKPLRKESEEIDTFYL